MNPKVANRFAQTIRRSKTDAADADVLAEYARRMPFTAWVAPSPGSMRLRSIVRHVESLSVQSAQNQNRLHAARGSTSTPACIVQDLKRSVASLELRIHKLRREAMTLVRQDDLLCKRFELLVSIPGIAQVDTNLNGELKAVTASKDFDLFITAEQSGIASSPTGVEVLHAHVARN